MPLVWSQLLMDYEWIGIVVAFWTLATLLAIEVWKKLFFMLSPGSGASFLGVGGL
jgi:hypothetical protein